MMNAPAKSSRTGWVRVRLVDPADVLVEVVPCPTFSMPPIVIVKGARAFIRAEGTHEDLETYREVFTYFPPQTSNWVI